MGLAKLRIKVSVLANVKASLTQLAKRDQLPTATKTERLTEVRAEIEEDLIWYKIAAKRDKKTIEFHSHTEVFKA